MGTLIFSTPTDGSEVFFGSIQLTPTTALKSIDFGTVVDVLAEGQIEGSATASKAGITDKTSTAYKNAFLKDLFLNKTAVLQADADNTNPADSEFNYLRNRIQFDSQDGTINNKVLFAAEKQSSEVITGDKGQECTFPQGGTAIPRSGTISDVEIDTVQVKVKFDQFFRIDTETGNRLSSLVKVIIKANPNNGSSQLLIDENVIGRSFNPYTRDYSIDLRLLDNYNTNTSGASGSFFPVVISVERGTVQGDSNTFNTMRLAEMRKIIREPHNYPNIAYTALRFSSELFPNTPARFFRIRGKLVKIPDNGTVELATGRLTYSGTFNGTFKTDKAWTSDPAWVLYDLLTDTTSGCAIPESELDPYTFYSVSTYCSALVDDGNGGQEPRFSINVNINNRRDAMTLIKDVCSVMRAMPYYEEGTIKIAQDAPKDHDNPSAVSFDYVFNNANVIEGAFTYSGTSSKTRFNVINVSYFDLNTQEIDYVTVEDATSKAKYGTQTKTINTFGTTSRGQAQRVGKWFLQTQQNQTESVVFETNIAAGSVLRIGDVIGIADRVKSSTRRGGLVKAVSSSQGNSNIDQITLDDAGATNLPNTSNNAKISCMLADGTVETKTIDDYVTGNVVKVSGNFTSAPLVNSPFILESGQIPVQAFSVINIKENTKKTYTITAINFNENKYLEVEDGTQLPEKNISILTSLLPSPQIINGTDGSKAIIESIIKVDGRPVPKLFIDWQSVEGASGYELIYIKDDENPVSLFKQLSEHTIIPSEAGTYKIQIYTINSRNKRSSTPTEITVNTVGLTAVPENPTGLEIEPLNNSQVRLSWTKTTSLDVEFGGACEIRHTPRSVSSATFANSNTLNENINGATNEAILPALSGTYSLKFRDIGGRFSVTEAKVELALPEMENELQLKNASGLDFRENPTFSGNKTNVTVSSNSLQLSNPASNLTGTYEFASVLDFEAVYKNIRLKRHVISEGFNISDQFDSIPDLDARGNFDGAGSDRTKSKLQVQTSQDNSSFTTEQNLFNGVFSARAFKFKSNLISVDVNENIKFTELGFDAFLPLREEITYKSSGNIISTPLQSTTSASGLDVVFGNPFFTGTTNIGGSTTAFLPSISIATEDAPSGAFHVLSAISREGFTIVFKNSSNTVIDVKFTFQAVGYGKGA
jgi:predicted phage tail protein